MHYEPDRAVAGRAHVVRTSRRAWERGYIRAVAALDALSALFAGMTAFLLGGRTYSPWYLAASAALPLVWVASMSASRAYEARFLAIGAEEFRRVLSAAMAVIAVVATLSLAIGAEMGRRYIAVALPMATLLTLLSRYVARKIVHRRRRRGFCMSDVLFVGHGRSVAELVRQVRREVHHGMRDVGVCVPDGCPSEDLARLGVPVHGTFADVEDALFRTGADTVAVLHAQRWTAPSCAGWRGLWPVVALTSLPRSWRSPVRASRSGRCVGCPAARGRASCRWQASGEKVFDRSHAAALFCCPRCWWESLWPYASPVPVARSSVRPGSPDAVPSPCGSSAP